MVKLSPGPLEEKVSGVGSGAAPPLHPPLLKITVRLSRKVHHLYHYCGSSHQGVSSLPQAPLLGSASLAAPCLLHPLPNPPLPLLLPTPGLSLS